MALDTAAIDKVLTTTRSVRRRLDTSRPVDRSIILDCIELAMQAPTGANIQTWRWIVVDDADKRAAIADIYRRGGEEYFGRVADKAESSSRMSDQTKRVISSSAYLFSMLEHVPVHVIPCLEQPIDHSTIIGSATAWAGILPAAWSFQLALRSRGLGSAWTTAHLAKSDELAELLEIPPTVTQAALFPVAYTLGGDFKPAARPGPETITSFNTWGERD